MLRYTIITKEGISIPRLTYYLPTYDCQNLYISKAPKQSIDNAQKAAYESNFLVVLGGDGTFHEAVEGVLQSKQNIPILYIPAGTCNDMATNVGYQKNLKEYIQKSMDNPIDFDTFQMNQELFCYIAAGGFLTYIPYQVTHQQKQYFGRNAYVYAMLLDVLHRPTIHSVKGNIDGAFFSGDYYAIIASNTYSIGQFPVYQNSSLKDGIFELMLISATSKWRILKELWEVLQRKRSLDQLSFADYYQGQQAEFLIHPIFPHPFCLDGEQAQIAKEQVNVEVKQKIKLMIAP